MTTLSFSELTAAVRGQGEGILAAGRQDLDADVPTCRDWTMRDLMTHVGRVYRRATTAVEERGTTEVPFSDPGEVTDPEAFLTEALDDLVHALSSTDADAPAWNWSGDNQTAHFWARRMTHESTVHHFDAQRARGLASPVDADLAQDGLDELVDIIGPRVISRDSPELPAGTFAFVATDDAAQWFLRLGADGIERLEVAKEPDVTVRGTASALLLAAYNRVPWASLDVAGDTTLLDGWTRALQF
jgi:uncharacterized protein (TIGR03083 family)